MQVQCAHAEMLDLHKLVQHPKNPNQHPEAQIEYLSKLIDYQGVRHPIIVSRLSGFIVAGHGRYLALKKLGYEKAPVDYQQFENEAQEYAFMVSDNKIAELAEHDDAKMFIDIEGIADLDLEMLGIPDFKILAEEVPLPELSDADKSPLQQMTFTFSNEQADQVKFAMDKAKTMGPFVDSVNENGNGNALARVCEMFNDQR